MRRLRLACFFAAAILLGACSGQSWLPTAVNNPTSTSNHAVTPPNRDAVVTPDCLPADETICVHGGCPSGATCSTGIGSPTSGGFPEPECPDVAGTGGGA